MWSGSSRLLLLAVAALLRSWACEADSPLGRSLLFPSPGGSETKVQVLFGLGLPMESEVSMTLGYVLKCNYNLPYNSSTLSEARRTKSRGEDYWRSGASRWSLYRLLEIGLGRGCLLRAVCEAAESPFDARLGLLGQLLAVILTPSLTDEEYESYADREYRAAEARGRKRDCRELRRGCSYGLLDYFTRIIDF